jgi:hypothetical protein
MQLHVLHQQQGLSWYVPCPNVTKSLDNITKPIGAANAYHVGKILNNPCLMLPSLSDTVIMGYFKCRGGRLHRTWNPFLPALCKHAKKYQIVCTTLVCCNAISLSMTLLLHVCHEPL